MTPSRTGRGRGNLEIDRVFAGIPVRRTSGTSNPKQFRQRIALLEKLSKSEERWELIRAFANQDLSIEQLIEADRDGRLAQSLDGILLAAPLWDTVQKILPKMGGKKNPEPTRKRYAVSFRQLQLKASLFLPADARVRSLKDVKWDRVADEWETSGTDWMHMRRAVSAFISRYLKLGPKDYHPFRRDVMYLIPTKTENKRKPNISVADFVTIVGKVPEHLQACYWTLAITGLRLNEYLTRTRKDLNPELHTIRVEEAKNDQSEGVIEVDVRFWSYVSSSVPCPVQEDWLRKVWNRAVEKAGYENIHLHDLRHCHGQWAADAGATQAHIQDSMRHKSPGMTIQYQLRGSTRAVSGKLADLILKPAPKKARRA